MWSAQNKESLKVAWHPNSRNPLLPAPGCRSVDLNKTWYGKLSFIFQHLKYSWKSRSQALAQHCFCFKNSPTTNLKENHIQDWFPWWTFTYIWKSKPTRIPKPTWTTGNHYLIWTIRLQPSIHSTFCIPNFWVSLPWPMQLPHWSPYNLHHTSKLFDVFVRRIMWHPTEWPNEIWYEDGWGKYREIMTSHFEVLIIFLEFWLILVIAKAPSSISNKCWSGASHRIPNHKAKSAIDHGVTGLFWGAKTAGKMMSHMFLNVSWPMRWVHCELAVRCFLDDEKMW